MIAPDESNGNGTFTPAESHDASRAPLPASTRVYVQGELFPEVQVPMREIALHDTKAFNGRVEKNEPVRVYDCSGPWGDPAFTGTSDEEMRWMMSSIESTSPPGVSSSMTTALASVRSASSMTRST